jgi:hypothetical protein
MSTLRQLLEATPYRMLRVIARRRGVTVPHNCARDGVVDLLTQALADPARLRVVLADLSTAEQALLGDLAAVGGRLPRYHVARRHGDVRPYRPWRPEAPERPWEAPQSPTERLYYLGLIFWDRDTDDLAAPSDLLPLLPAPSHPPPPCPASASEAPGAASIAMHDVALLLALLEARDVRPLHGRWLPPRLLAAWGRRCAAPPRHIEARGERQTGRRRFLHYLAKAAGLIAPVGELLKPTPAGWQWLQAGPAARLRALWEAFAAPQAERWRAYRLPGYRSLGHPAILVEAVLETLPIHDPADPQSFAAALLAWDPALRNDLHDQPLNADELLTEIIVRLLTGPLTWLGVLTGGEGGRLAITPWGAARLGLGEEPVLAPPLPLERDVDLAFALPAGLPDPLALATLETCAEGLEGGRYRVTPVSLAGALHRGQALPDLLDRLNRLAERPLTGQERATLAEWAQAAERVTIRRLTVLETADPAVIARLSEARRARRLIRRTLSRRAVVVDERGLPLLVRRLTEQEDLPPWVDLPPSDPPADPALGRGGAAHLWMTAKVYQELGHFVRLPVRLPEGLLDHLAALAEPSDLSAAESAAERVLEALKDGLDGYPSFPAWGEPGLPVEQTRAVIEGALAEGGALQMAYFTAGRGEMTHRVVEPLRLEERGGAVYLVGFCHRAQDERVFRLDRIHSVVKVPLPEGYASGLDI